jgi:hypothetical protein
MPDGVKRSSLYQRSINDEEEKVLRLWQQEAVKSVQVSVSKHFFLYHWRWGKNMPQMSMNTVDVCEYARVPAVGRRESQVSISPIF